ncbi:MAG: AsmA family protein [Rhizobiales bacterium]|nr:AsmA family protein [Hyphomicrobiales bacterium]
MSEEDDTRTTRRPGRIWAIALAVVMALGLWAGLAVRQLTSPAAREALTRRIGEIAGLELTARRVGLRIVPTPRLRIEAPTFRDANGGLSGRADAIDAELRWADLLIGRVALSALVVRDADIAVDLDRDAPDWRLRLANPVSGGAGWIPALSLVNARLRVARPSTGLDERLDGLDATLWWRSRHAPASVAAEFRWRAEATRVSAWLGAPATVLAGGESPMRVELHAPSIDLEFGGHLGGERGESLAGRLSLASPSLRRLLWLTTFDPPLPGAAERLRLDCDVNLRARALSLSDTRIELDESDFDGVLSLRYEDGAPSLSGTLDTSRLDLARWLSGAQPLFEPDGAWSQTAIDLPAAGRGSVDLRVSAEKLKWGALSLADTALTISVKRGRAEFAISEATGYGGDLRGRLTVTRSGAGVEARGTAQVARVDLGALSEALTGARRVTGEGGGSLSFEATGATPADLAGRLAGRAQFDLRNGELRGLDLEQALRRGARAQLTGALLAPAARTGFDRLSAVLRIAAGAARIEQGVLAGPGATADLGGAISIPERALSIRVEARQSGARETPPFVFYLAGPWAAPSVLAEPEFRGPPPAVGGR